MKPSTEFLQFAAQFHQDIFDVCTTPEESINTALGIFSKNELTALSEFLDSIMEFNDSSAKFLRLWNTSDADFLFPDLRTAQHFLLKTKSLINEKIE